MMSDKLNLKYTGNVFVDAGIYALVSNFDINIEDITKNHILQLFKQVASLYTNPIWNKNMHTIFPNSILVNNSIKGDREKLYLKHLNGLIDNLEPSTESGDCMACGVRNSTSSYQKNAIPLTGSKSLRNYFSFATEGVDYCSLCVALIQFAPLVMYRSGGRMILLHSNSNKVMEYWARKARKNINKQILTGEYTGCFNEGFTNPTNAIFRIIQSIVFSYDERWVDENPSLNFYYFTNFNQGPDLQMFYVPSNVFRFLAYIPQDNSSNWNLIVKKAYKFVKWDKVKEFDEYKNNPNEVYNRLLKEVSILRFFYDFKSKKALCSWNLVKYYMNEVRNMDNKRVNAIRNLGDKLSKYIKNNNKRKVLSDLENAKNYNTFRNILRKIIKNKMANNDYDLLFTFDDYIVYLFPEGNLSWKETQDLLLFRIYENLNSWLIEMNYVENEEE